MKKIYKKVLRTIFITVLILAIGVPQTITSAGREESAIDWLEKMGFINSDFNLKSIKANPEKAISRQGFISILMLAADAGKSKNKTAKKLLKSAYSDCGKIKSGLNKYIATAYKLGVTQLPENDAKIKLMPKTETTRQMAAYYIGRCLNMKMDVVLEDVSDYRKVNEMCKPYVTALVNEGIMMPIGRKFKYKKALTWNDAAEMIKAIYEAGYFDDKETDITIDRLVSGEENNKIISVGGVVKDEKSEVIYITDTSANMIYALKNSQLTAVAGSKTVIGFDGRYIGGYKDGTAKEALFNEPTGIMLMNDGLLVADTGNNVLRFINLKTSEVFTYAGDGKAGNNNSKGIEASFNRPTETAVSADGTIYVADSGNNCIRMIDADGNVTVYAGKSYQAGYKDGSVDTAQFNYPTGIAVDGDNIYIADCGNQRIRKISEGTVTTLAGSGTEQDVNSNEYVGGFRNGNALDAYFNYPSHIAAGEAGELYISDTGNGMIRKLADGVVTTVAGFGNCVVQKGFDWSTGLSVPAYITYSAGNGRLYIADTFLMKLISIKLK